MIALSDCQNLKGGISASRRSAVLLGSMVMISALSACNYVPASRWNLSQNQAQVSAITVLPQQSIYDVARQENVPVEALAMQNGLQPPYQIYVGQKLQMPSRAYPAVAYANNGAPRAIGAGQVASAPIQSGPISAGNIASETLTVPATGQTVQPGEPGLYGSVEATELQSAPAASTGGPVVPSNNQWNVASANVGAPPPPGTIEVLEAAPRASEPQVASLPTPGVSDVAVDNGFTQVAVPAPRPLMPPRDEPAAPVAAPQAVAAPIESLEPVPVPDLPQDAPAELEVAAAPPPPAPVMEAPEASQAVPLSIEDLPPIGEQGFAWPLTGEIISTFGAGGSDSANDGINIRTTMGTEILAAQDGFVVYAGNELVGFGNLILIRHADNWVTGYAHADHMLVSKDQFVRAGEVIGTVGKTGAVNEPQLHFEVRQGTQAVDPAAHLPPMPL